jgi:hypothetical protein
MTQAELLQKLEDDMSARFDAIDAELAVIHEHVDEVITMLEAMGAVPPAEPPAETESRRKHHV